MGYLIAYRHTGADPAYLDQLLPLVRDAFSSGGVDTYCTYFDEASFQQEHLTPEKIMEHAFTKIEELGGLFVLLDGEEKSDGQIMEVGYCLAKDIPFIVAKRRSVANTYIHRMTNRSFEYDSLDELASGIKTVCSEMSSTS
ncbi:MAG TPA: hypothetical protein PKD20_00305 [Candidatus Saccharibacteria bacterium]|nr:hypothetical protein [Candidatus Saccharibacteria bacterium]HMT55298.1 hypothetical protein [Candidatus Saccharibacteria bacterium]